MTLQVWQSVSIALAASVAVMFCAPWLALSRSFGRFEPGVLIAVSREMSRNMTQVMTVLLPGAIVSVVPVLYLSYGGGPAPFALNLFGMALLVASLLVTMLVEVPIVERMRAWTLETLPADWEAARDRWGAFHYARMAASLGGVAALVAGVMLRSS